MFYGFARGVLLALSKVLFRIKITGTEHVPTSGVFIVAPSHRSYFDTPFASFITRRRIRFMAKEELFEHPLGAKLFLALGGIPVTRGSASARSAPRPCSTRSRPASPRRCSPKARGRTG